MQDQDYDTAQICENGHVITSAVFRYPSMQAEHCVECGAPTLAACPGCEATIRGSWGGGNYPYDAPSFCHKCGKAYPWTEKRLAAARELAEEVEGLDAEERRLLTLSLDDLVQDSPATSVAVVRFKKLVKKAGGETASALKDILVDIVSETARKALWPK